MRGLGIEGILVNPSNFYEENIMKKKAVIIVAGGLTVVSVYLWLRKRSNLKGSKDNYLVFSP